MASTRSIPLEGEEESYTHTHNQRNSNVRCFGVFGERQRCNRFLCDFSLYFLSLCFSLYRCQENAFHLIMMPHYYYKSIQCMPSLCGLLLLTMLLERRRQTRIMSKYLKHLSIFVHFICFHSLIHPPAIEYVFDVFDVFLGDRNTIFYTLAVFLRSPSHSLHRRKIK